MKAKIGDEVYSIQNSRDFISFFKNAKKWCWELHPGWIKVNAGVYIPIKLEVWKCELYKELLYV